jgi:hypothetical protein
MRKQMNQEVQDAILGMAMQALTAAADQNQSDEYLAAMRDQLARVEKLFGYTPGSWRA